MELPIYKSDLRAIFKFSNLSTDQESKLGTCDFATSLVRYLCHQKKNINSEQYFMYATSSCSLALGALWHDGIGCDAQQGSELLVILKQLLM